VTKLVLSLRRNEMGVLRVGLTFYDESGENVLVESKFGSDFDIVPENKRDLVNPSEEFLDETSRILFHFISVDLQDKVKEMLSYLMKGE
jgi:hypothetical protein